MDGLKGSSGHADLPQQRGLLDSTKADLPCRRWILFAPVGVLIA
jgi:hypothetical protein